MRSRFPAILGLMVCASCASAPSRPIMVAFSGITPMKPALHPVSASAADLIEDRLSRGAGFTLVEDHRLATNPPESSLELGRRLGAEWVVSGAIIEAGVQDQVGGVVLSVRVENVLTGEEILSRVMRGTAKGLPSAKEETLLNRAAQDAAQQLVQEVIQLAR